MHAAVATTNLQVSKYKLGYIRRARYVAPAASPVPRPMPASLPTWRLPTPPLLGHARTVQRMNAPRQRTYNTNEFERKHILTATGDPAGRLSDAVRAGRSRLLFTTYDRQQGRVRAATWLILTTRQLADFQLHARQGTFNGHAFSYAVTVTPTQDGGDEVTLLGNGTFDLDTSLLSPYSIDHLVARRLPRPGDPVLGAPGCGRQAVACG